jgi:23S rRNA (uracil1939-C5)-methyltransferase
MPRRRTRSLPDFPEPLRVERFATNGDGLSRCGERELRIAGALPGERVRVTARRRRKGYLQCVVTEVEHAARERAEPFCSRALICGGCTLQHLAYEAQLEYKTERLRESMAEAGVRAKWVLPPVTGPVRGYRRKARLGVRFVPKKGGVLVGFRESGSSLVTETDACPVLVPMVGERIGTLRTLVSRLSEPSRVPQIEIAAGDREAALVVRHLYPLSSADIALLDDYGRATSLHIYLQPRGPASVAKLYPDDGLERLEYRLSAFELRLRFHPLDFVQVNGWVNDSMVSRATELLDVKPGERVVDLFCGVGNFSLAIAAAGAEVVGVEGSSDLVARAVENCALNGISNAKFMAVDLYRSELAVSVAALECTKLLLDPPRSGAWEVVTQLPLGGIERIVYVSCSRETFARDARVLVERGFELESLSVLDMFPHTGHVESMGLFRR